MSQDHDDFGELYVYCDNCSACLDWQGSTIEDVYVRVLVEKGKEATEKLDGQLATSCDDVLVMRGTDPIENETWCEKCLLGARLRGCYTFEGRKTFGRLYERTGRKGYGAQPVRVRLLREDLTE